MHPVCAQDKTFKGSLGPEVEVSKRHGEELGPDSVTFSGKDEKKCAKL